jgi:dienelactone hydrolase
MAAGFSYGGVEAMAQAWDQRVKSLGIYSSGLLTNYTAAANFPQPILFPLGGPRDVAYANVSTFSLHLFNLGASS